jgi:molybdate transport system regulatory protein
MSLSIRNQLPVTVVSVQHGAVMSTVKTRLASGQELTASVTKEAADELAVDAGTKARLLIKSTDVALATGVVSGLSIRNQIKGTVSGVELGEAMATVKIDAGVGITLTSAITRDAATDLALATGTEVTALIKSTEVSIATA